MFTGKHLRWSLFLIKMFSCECCEIFKNTYFIEHHRWLLLKGVNLEILKSWEDDFRKTLESMKEFIATEIYSVKADVGPYMVSRSRNASISDKRYRKKGKIFH